MNQKNNEVRVCPVCHGNQADVIFHRDFSRQQELVPFPAYDVVLCHDCGMGYARPSAVDNLERYYAVNSKYESMEASQEDKARYAHIADFFVSHEIPLTSKIIDVGCSFGGLLATLRTYDFSKLTGLDPSEKCCEFMRSNGLQTLCGTIGKPVAEKYDIVSLEAVLEHLLDLDSVINYLVSLIEDDGMIYIGVPNAERFFEHAADFYQEFSMEHINYFSLDSLRNLMGRLELQLIDAECEETVIRSLWRKGERKKITKDVGLGKALDRYITLGGQQVEKVNKTLSPYRGVRIIVFGGGTLLATLLDKTLLKDMDIAFVVDSNVHYQGRKIGGIEVRSPDVLADHPELPIIITASTSARRSIVDMLSGMKVKNKIVILQE